MAYLKSLFFIIPLSFAFSAEPQITEGLISSAGGVTFANKTAMEEAIARGAGDDRNPFVENVGCLMFSTENGFYSATITRIAPDVYLTGKHTLIGIKSNSETLGVRMQLALKFGNVFLCQATGMMAVPHPEQDFAVVKMTFASTQGSFSASADVTFLSILPTPITDDKFPAFSVSCAEPFYATPGGAVGVIPSDASLSAKMHRVLSVHNIETASFSSFIAGRLPIALTEEIIETVASCNLEAIKVTSRKGTFFLGADHRLASTCSFGASGSPLISKIAGEFFLTGILNTGVTCPRILRGADMVMAIAPSQLLALEHTNRFLNLTPYASWIADAILRVNSPS